MKIETTTHTLEEVQQEYANTCAKAGALQYQIAALTWDLRDVNEKLKALNHEAHSLMQLQKANQTTETETQVSKLEPKKETA